MLIPTYVGAGSSAVLAVPDTSYWCKTSAEYFINPPGVSTTAGCVWGSASQPVGNWASFVCGANMDTNGNTFVTVGANPIYWCEPANGYSQRDPGYAVKIECPQGGCVGLPCQCDPSTMGPNKCSGGTVGAGGAEFCVVTVQKGYKANIVVYSTGSNANTGSNNNNNNSTGTYSTPVSAPAPAPPPPPPPQAPTQTPG